MKIIMMVQEVIISGMYITFEQVFIYLFDIEFEEHDQNQKRFDKKSYNYRFETSDGISRDENGYVKNGKDPENIILVVTGSYSYQGPDGILYTVSYIADENGFRPVGTHIPTLPEIPVIVSK